MWKKATLPLLLLLLLLTALLLAQSAATEPTQPAANAEDIVTTSNSSTEHFVATALDINDKDDHADADADADEATVETYEGDDEETSAARRTKEATPQLSIKTTPTSEDVGEWAEESIESHNDKGVKNEQTNVGEEANAPDVGRGDGDAECSGEGAAATDDDSVGVDGEDCDETRREVSSSLEQRVRDRLAFIMIREITRLIDYALEEQRSVVNRFLQDETIEMVKCATMEAVKKSCVSFIAGVRDALTMDKSKDFPTQLVLFGVKTLMARNFESFVEQHNTTRIKQPTAENVIIDNALKKAGVLQIEVEMQKRFVEFTRFFTSTVGDYVQTIKEEQKRGDFDEKLLVWYRQFMTATNISNQVNVLCKFLPLYKDMFSIESDAD